MLKAQPEPLTADLDCPLDDDRILDFVGYRAGCLHSRWVEVEGAPSDKCIYCGASGTLLEDWPEENRTCPRCDETTLYCICSWMT